MGIVVDATSTESSQLDQLVVLAVERTYRAFAPHHLGSSMTVRRPDVTPEEVAALGGPLRAVDARSIDRWLPHAISTWGGADDVQALLPRVLELFAAGELTTPPEVVFGKLRRAGAGSWPLDEQAATEDAVTAIWLATLATHPPKIRHPAWRLLVAMAELGGDLGPFLDDWSLLLGSGTSEGRAANRHLYDLNRRLQSLADAGLGVAALFWSPSDHEAERLERWLDQPFRLSPLSS